MYRERQMKCIVIIFLGLVFIAHNTHAQLLLPMYQKMKLIRERNNIHESILMADSLTAEDGNVHLQLTCALRYWGKGDYTTARHFLDKAIKVKNDTAMVYLAEMNYYGYGASNPDVDSALKLANKALSFGNTLSYFIIGKFYYDMKDYVKAFNCFTSVPDNSPNIRLNNYYIAICYRYGRGVQLDINKSLEYFHKANMYRTPSWWEKHHHRIKELNQISQIAEILGIASNPEFEEISYLSKGDTLHTKTDRITRNIERAQKRYKDLLRKLEEQSQKQ